RLVVPGLYGTRAVAPAIDAAAPGADGVVWSATRIAAGDRLRLRVLPGRVPASLFPRGRRGHLGERRPMRPRTLRARGARRRLHRHTVCRGEFRRRLPVGYRGAPEISTRVAGQGAPGPG